MEFTVDELFDALGVEQPQEEAQEEAMPRDGGPGPVIGPGGAGAAPQPESPEEKEEDGGAAEGGEAPEAAGEAPAQPEAAVKAAVDAALAARDEEHRRALEAMERRQREQWEEFFRSAQLQNTVTGKPITTREEFDAWKREFDAARLERELKEGRLTREGLDAAIASSPAVQQAQQLARQQADAQRQRQDAEAQARINAEIAEIGKLEPGVKTVEDLLKLPNARQFYEYVRRGNTFLDAYYLANRESLAKKAEEAAAIKVRQAQQAAMNARGKDHLRQTSAQGGGGESVPRGEMELFRALLPEAGAEDIQKYYTSYKKGGTSA